MKRILVDSACSIKQSELKNYDIEIIPLRLFICGREYLDGIDVDSNLTYSLIESAKELPKTSLPSIPEVESKVKKYTRQGDEVIIVCLSSKISATYEVMKNRFASEKVRVIDSASAVGGMRFIVREIIKYRNESLEFIENKVNELIPKIKILAVPETLDYLLKGGRLKRSEWMIGKILRILPIITIKNGRVTAQEKRIGLRRSLQYIVNEIEKSGVDLRYDFIGSYTKDRKNLNELEEKIKNRLGYSFTLYDDLIPSIAVHWGPNAFGVIYVSK